MTRLLTRSSDVDLVDAVNPSKGPGKQMQLCVASATRRSRSRPVAGISGRAPHVGPEICVYRQSVLPPISHKPPFPSRCLATDRLDRVVEVLRPLPRGPANSTLGVTPQKKEKSDQTFSNQLCTSQECRETTLRSHRR